MTQAFPLIRIDLAYNGGPFCGWQKQKHLGNSLQQVIEEALERLFRAKVSIQASGRTDAGVHARHQVFHFRAPKAIEKYRIHRGLARYLPKEIQVLAAYIAPEDFHARFQAKAKEYRYYIYPSKTIDPFKDAFMTPYSKPIQLDQLNAYANTLVGSHDFSYFANRGNVVRTPVRKMYKAAWKQQGDAYIFRVIGNGFLKQMVRNFVGNMLYALESGWSTEQFAGLLGKKPGGEYRRSAPAQGLFLYRVYYSSQLDKKCLKLYE